ncbi:hypothetical protein GIB67_021526 [Kingdonia uniflora]|uniref:Uncharacterized protein n=1 Tax=Kingdonia uniflora TaxID=39325 RepID=A0A7J7L9J4_9MAGN|nr:hypothetical protein GIB67_021526 [Kingdonia uniflora]
MGDEPLVHVPNGEDTAEGGAFGSTDEEIPVAESIVTCKPKRNVGKPEWLTKAKAMVKNVKLPKKSIDGLQSNKKLVEHALYFLQLHKSSISISHCQKVGYWEKQMPTILTTIGLEKACSSQHLEQQLRSPIAHPMQPTNFQATMTRSPQTSLTSGSSIIGSLNTVGMGSLHQNTVTASL